MKKILFVILVVIIVIIILLLVFGKGLGFGNGMGKGDAGNEGQHSAESNVSVNEERINASVKSEEKKEKNISRVKVTVHEKEYIYENATMSLDDLINKLVSIEGDIIVEIKDENATLKAYNKLIDALKDKKIDYKE